jgi:hypothetical protein
MVLFTVSKRNLQSLSLLANVMKKWLLGGADDVFEDW